MMRSRVLLGLLLGLILGFAIPRSTLADTTATWHGTIKGVQTWITVVPRGYTISAQTQAQEPWWRWGNVTTDAYLFAFNRPADVRLILDFQQQDGTPEARIYLNRLGREPLDYALEGDQLLVRTNGGFPYLRIRPDGSGWTIQGRANYRLNLWLDGLFPAFGDREATTDGVVDVVMQVGGAQPGVPDWQTIRLAHDPHPGWGYSRFSALRRMRDAPPFKVAAPLMPTFPYFDMGLGVADPNSPYVGIGGGDIDWFQKNPNPLYFNLRFFEFQVFAFPGFQHGGMYYYNSLASPPEVDFESPFAFYSFDTTTRYPQLVVRGSYFRAKDAYVPTSSADRSSFRYSWKVGGKDAFWKYSLDVTGSYSYTQEIKIGDDSFAGVSPEDLPGWVTSKPWPLVTFVEAVNGYPSSEGIYFYTAQATENWPWLDGSSGQPPGFLAEPYLQRGVRLGAYSGLSLPEGFRGEYNTAYFRQPTMYMSPIDNRMHLLHAQGGVWNLGAGQVLRTHNLVGGAYIDGWTRERVSLEADQTGLPEAAPGVVEEALYALDGYLIYSGPHGAELRQVEYSPARFESAPPADKQSWQTFRDQVGPYSGQERDPSNLRAWLDAFQGQSLIVSKGQIWGARATDRGFRFVVDLQPGFRLQGPNTQAFKPGLYVATYDGRWTIVPLTPPAPTAALNQTTLTQLQPGALEVELGNNGRQDLPKATLELWAAPPQGPATVVATRTIALLAQTPLTTTLQWAAPAAGRWELTPKIRQPDGKLIAFKPTQVTVVPTRAAAPAAMVAASATPEAQPFILAGLGVFVALAAAIVWRQWSRAPGGQVDDAA
jgi:hypothetical protein